jgi:hypothetical protein
MGRDLTGASWRDFRESARNLLVCLLEPAQDFIAAAHSVVERGLGRLASALFGLVADNLMRTDGSYAA